MSMADSLSYFPILVSDFSVLLTKHNCINPIRLIWILRIPVTRVFHLDAGTNNAADLRMPRIHWTTVLSSPWLREPRGTPAFTDTPSCTLVWNALAPLVTSILPLSSQQPLPTRLGCSIITNVQLAAKLPGAGPMVTSGKPPPNKFMSIVDGAFLAMSQSTSI